MEEKDEDNKSSSFLLVLFGRGGILCLGLGQGLLLGSVVLDFLGLLGRFLRS